MLMTPTIASCSCLGSFGVGLASSPMEIAFWWRKGHKQKSRRMGSEEQRVPTHLTHLKTVQFHSRNGPECRSRVTARRTGAAAEAGAGNICELQSTWNCLSRRKYSFNLSLKRATKWADKKVEREKEGYLTHLAHQRRIVQLVQCRSIGSLYGHHISIIIEPWQRFARKMPAGERWVQLHTHTYTHTYYFDIKLTENFCHISYRIHYRWAIRGPPAIHSNRHRILHSAAPPESVWSSADP